MYSNDVYRSSDEYIQDFEDIEAGFLVFIPCFIGFLMTIIVIRGCYVLPAMRGTFGYLLKYNMISGIVAPINMGIFYFFGVLWDIKFVINNSQFFGLISTTLVPILQSQYLMISLNRFFALVTPTHYNQIYHQKIRGFYVSMCWMVPIIYTTMFAYYYDCSYKFFHYGWVFTYAISESCGSKFEALLRGVQGTLTYAMVLVDIITMSLLICFRKRVLKSKSAEFRKREVNFGQQVVIQGFVFMFYGILYALGNRWIPQTMSEKWRIFWTTAFSANLLPIITTSVIFIFNSEFAKWLRCCSKKSKSNFIIAIIKK